MVTEVSAYKYLCNWYQMYEQARDAGQLSTVGDLPNDLALQEKFIDPADEDLRFFPVDYQDFWTCMDVNSAFKYMGTVRNSLYTKWRNPYWPVQPQIATYQEYLNQDTIPYQGWNIKVDAGYSYGGNSFWWSHDWAYLCCATDAPGWLANVGTDKSSPYFATKGGTNGHTGSAGWYELLWRSVSAENGQPNVLSGRDLPLWTAISSTTISAGYALSAPSFTHQLCCALSAFPKKLFASDTSFNSYSYDDEGQISGHFNGNYATDFADWGSTGGKFKEHDFHRSGAMSAWIERWGGSYNYESNSDSEVQRIDWSYDRSLCCQYCSYKSYTPPKNNESGKVFRFYVNAPTLCMYGDLSADVYQTWAVNFGDWLCWFWLKRTLTFENSGLRVWKYSNAPTHCLLQSKETFSFEDLYCLWKPFDEANAKTRLNSLRQSAGLSAWAFSDGQIPRSDDYLYRHQARVTKYPDYIVWKFSHPLLKEPGYHFANQDPPQT